MQTKGAVVPAEQAAAANERQRHISIAQRLKQQGIAAALQLADSNINVIRNNFEVIVERIARELNGESCLAPEYAPPPKQQIVNSRSFSQRVTQLEHMQQAVVLYATRAAKKLREQNSRCRHISVSIATGRHGNEPQFSNTTSRICDYPTNDTCDIIASALHCLNSIWRDGYRYGKAGVMLGDFYLSRVAQFDVFSDQLLRANADALMAALDSINRSGRGKVWFAGQVESDSIWRMKREMLSPRYTTRFADIENS